MGNVTFNCVSCLNREDEEHGVKPLNSYRAPQDAEEQNNSTGKEFQIPSALAKAAEEQWQKAPAGSDSELQNQINAIVSAHAQRCKPSPAKSSPDSALQAQINYIVGAHAKSLNQQRKEVAKTTELVSPSPAKSYTDDELGYFANIALSQAKARSTPSKTPTPLYIPRMTSEDEILPCQLNFADYDNENDAPPTTDVPEPKFSADGDSKKDLDDDPKSQTRPFNLSEIPSPTRNRAEKFWAEAAKVAAEEDLADSTLDEAHREYLEKKREEREAEKKSEAENKEFYSAEEDEEDDEEDEDENEEAVRLRAKLLREAEEKRQQRSQHRYRVVFRSTAPFLQQACRCHLQAANHQLSQLDEMMGVPVDLELKIMFADWRPVVREMAYRRLERLAYEGSSEATKMIVAIVNSENESQLLRMWALKDFVNLVDGRCAMHMLLKKGSPVQSSNSIVQKRAIDMLDSLFFSQQLYAKLRRLGQIKPWQWRGAVHDDTDPGKPWPDEHLASWRGTVQDVL